VVYKALLLRNYSRNSLRGKRKFQEIQDETSTEAPNRNTFPGALNPRNRVFCAVRYRTFPMHVFSDLYGKKESGTWYMLNTVK
jgi:hypothetical protein